MGATGPGESPSIRSVVDRDESAALRTLVRDLTRLLTLPASWSDQPLRSLIRILFEALESMMPLELAYVGARSVSGAVGGSIEILRLERQPADDRLTDWHPLLAPCFGAPDSPTATIVTSSNLPPLRVVRLPISADAQGGLALFGSQQPDFPNAFQDTLLHAAAGLAASGLRNAWLMEEREAVVQARDEFLAMLGHELRNPLAPIVTALHLIAHRGGSAMTRELDIVGRQVGQLTQIVDDLLDVSRAARGKIVLNKQPIELAEIVGQALEQVDPLLESRGHRLRLDVPSEGLPIDGDPTRLTQVVTNLLTNAAKYTDHQGQIDVVAIRHGPSIELSVKDNGLGISPELLPSLFDIFVQGRRTAKRTEGLGIGLTLVKRLLELHGGSVTARSEGSGKGSEFIVQLPVSAADPRTPTSVPSPPLGVVRAMARVAVIDDSRDTVDMLSEVLRAAGHPVASATEGTRALELVEGFGATVVLLDLALPGMDGYEVAKQIRTRLGTAAPRLIAMSGYDREDDRARSQEAGFTLHLVKPVDLAQLLAAIRQPGRPADRSRTAAGSSHAG